MIGASGQEGASAEEQPAITASHGQPGNVGYRMTAFGQYEDDNTASTLKQRDHKDATDLVAQAFNWQSGGDARGLDLTDQPSALTTQQTPAVLLQGVSYDGYNQTLEVGVHRSLRIGRDSSDFIANVDTLQYGVRRLTPVECERLQAFPDGWTEPAVSDSARYKALGNAVTVNTVRWVLGRMLEQTREDAT
jgi:DNA (cytosine-5)-methyltransferase 1